MQTPYQRITHWITTQTPIFKADKAPIAENPFYLFPTPECEPYTGNPRLGFVYQELCRQLFVYHPNFQIIADEVQLNSDKQTIGAIDFLVDNLGEIEPIEHWEVAIKFYLLKEGLWFGPDSRDRLDIKLNRMLTHQLAMANTATFKDYFPDLHNVKPKMLMQGRLYINPFEPKEIPTHCLNYEIDQRNIAGYWCYQHQIDKIKEPLYRLQKLDWIAGNAQSNDPVITQTKYAVHYQTPSNQFWFVVPNNWPN